MLIRKEHLSIGEVSQVTGVAIHTLRYWESEFGEYFAPARTKGRQRRYTETDIGRVMEIRKLLKEDKYSIAGAKQVLAGTSQDCGAGRANGHSGMGPGDLRLAGRLAGEFMAFPGFNAS